MFLSICVKGLNRISQSRVTVIRSTCNHIDDIRMISHEVESLEIEVQRFTIEPRITPLCQQLGKHLTREGQVSDMFGMTDHDQSRRHTTDMLSIGNKGLEADRQTICMTDYWTISILIYPLQDSTHRRFIWTKTRTVCVINIYERKTAFLL